VQQGIGSCGPLPKVWSLTVACFPADDREATPERSDEIVDSLIGIMNAYTSAELLQHVDGRSARRVHTPSDA